MQSHFITNNVSVDIPVVRVMNAAHFMLAYAFANTCSGDQGEYDALAYGSVGHDKQVMLVTLIVLAAILKRTEGLRARVCHNMLLEDRSEDFYDGVSLYDQFLRSAEKHFAEEDFLLDTHAQMQRLQEENEQLISENKQLKYQITKMEEKYTQINIGTQYKQDNNQGTIYNGPVTINQYPASPSSVSSEFDSDIPSSSSGAPDFSSEIPTREESPKEKPYTPPVPREGDYNGVRLYIEERKKYDEQFKDYCLHHNRKELCSFLTKEFGWFVDDKSLGKNISRNI